MTSPVQNEFALLLLSGAVATGKSSIAGELQGSYKFHRIRTSTFLQRLAEERGIEVGRTTLQDLGDELDLTTDYQWPITLAQQQIDVDTSAKKWLLDAVRKRKQVQHFRSHFGPNVLHVHLTAPETVIQERYGRRSDSIDGSQDVLAYSRLISHSNEIESRSLIEIADFVIDTSIHSPIETATMINKALQEM